MLLLFLQSVSLCVACFATWWLNERVDLRDYELFVQLSDTMHFARTARKTGMSPSALTRRVQAMEEELGHQLVIRDHRELGLTAAGVRFRSFAQSQVEQWNQLGSDLREEAASPSGSLNIACTVTAVHTVLPKLLSKYRELYPGVTLRLITQDTTRSLNQLEAGEVDLAVIPTEENAPDNLKKIVLARTELTFIGPKVPGTWAEALKGKKPDYAEVPFIAPISGLERRRLEDWLRARRIAPHIVAEVRGNEGIIAMVSLGGGVGLVPRLVLSSSPLSHSVVELSELGAPPGYDVSLCTRGPNLERRVISLFWQLAAQNLLSDRGC